MLPSPFNVYIQCIDSNFNGNLKYDYMHSKNNVLLIDAEKTETEQNKFE